MKEDSKTELVGVTGRGGPHETIADTKPKIFFGAEEDESPTDSNRPAIPRQNNRITEQFSLN